MAGDSKGNEMSAAAVALMAMLLLVSAASQFHPLHARPVATPGSHLMPGSSHDDDANATAVSQPPPPPPAAAVAATGGGGLKRSSSPSGCTNYGPGGGGAGICPPC